MRVVMARRIVVFAAGGCPWSQTVLWCLLTQVMTGSAARRRGDLRACWWRLRNDLVISAGSPSPATCTDNGHRLLTPLDRFAQLRPASPY